MHGEFQELEKETKDIIKLFKFVIYNDVHFSQFYMVQTTFLLEIHFCTNIK